MTIPSLLTPTFWFTTTPPPFSFWADRILAVLTIALTVLGVIALVYLVRSKMEKRVRRIFQDVSWNMIWLGLAGLLLYGFMYERIPVLSMRAIWLLWLGWIVWVVYSTWKKLKIDLPADNQRYAERDRLSKWLPKKNS
jgi:hypothetical protein